MNYFQNIVTLMNLICFVRSEPGLFDLDSEKLIKDIVGDLDAEKMHWTTPNEYRYIEDQLSNYQEVTRKMVTSTKRRFTTPNKNSKEYKKRLKEFKSIKMLRDVENILNDTRGGIPNFEVDDDPQIITRRFDEQNKLLKEKAIMNPETGGRRQHFSWREDKKRQFVRNRSISAMEHFVYATRYKIVFAQVLRKKYRNMVRYKIGYCFGLLSHLQRMQYLLYTSLKSQHTKVSTIHFHMRMYEKVVRLGVDIKDAIRITRTLESQRRIAADPKYYELYYEDTTTSRSRFDGRFPGRPNVDQGPAEPPPPPPGTGPTGAPPAEKPPEPEKAPEPEKQPEKKPEEKPGA